MPFTPWFQYKNRFSNRSFSHTHTVGFYDQDCPRKKNVRHTLTFKSQSPIVAIEFITTESKEGDNEALL